MQYKDFISVISSDVARILQENSDNIAESLLSGIPEQTPCMSPEQFQIVQNAITVSAQLSVQIIFDYLDSLGMLNCQNLSEHFERPALKVIQGKAAVDKDK